MTNVIGGPRHIILFEMTNFSSADAGSDQANPPVNLSALTNLGDAVQMETRYGRHIWPACLSVYRGQLQSTGKRSFRDIIQAKLAPPTQRFVACISCGCPGKGPRSKPQMPVLVCCSMRMCGLRKWLWYRVSLRFLDAPSPIEMP